MNRSSFQSTSGSFLLYLCMVASIGCHEKYVERPSGYYDENAVTTAEELFAELETQTDRWNGKVHRTSNLSENELKIATDSLREKYPIQSLRDRLHFQETDPKPVRRIPKGTGKLYEDGFFSQRARALRDLHSSEVHRFINRNGQGLMRMPPPEPADLRLWANDSSQFQSIKVDSKILGESIIELPASFAKDDANHWDVSRLAFSPSGMPSLELASRFHESAARDFSSPETLGYVRNIDEVAGFLAHKIRMGTKPSPTLRMWNVDYLRKEHPALSRVDVSWKLNRLKLVSLLVHDEPRVYETENLPDMEELSGKNVDTRPLNDFESHGLEELNGGKEVFTVATHNRIVMLGAVRADKSCMECHSTKKGELLGAFSYEFLRDPVEVEPSFESKSL